MLLRLCFFLLVCSQPLFSEIFDVRLTLDGLKCPFCPRSVAYALRDVDGVEDITVFSYEGLVQAVWKKDEPFSADEIFHAFFKSRYRVLEIDVDVEGTINKKRGNVFLFSQPDGSKFYIANTDAFRVFEDGQRVRLRGYVTAKQGINYLNIQEALSPEIK